MKPVDFALRRGADLAELGGILAEHEGAARIMAGGQSLGPMLNLRVATPEMVVPIGRLAELAGAQETDDAVTIGACVTHAAIADGRVPDIGGGILADIAENIAYRAVRNRGTIGGSLCHADPAADWPCTLTALGATVLTWHATRSARSLRLEDFILGAFRTALEPGEILQAVRVPKLSPRARWGYFKACRKPGEFAHAMAAFFEDSARGVRRAVIGATGSRAIVLDGPAAEAEAARAALLRNGFDPVGVHMQMTALRRAMEQAAA